MSTVRHSAKWMNKNGKGIFWSLVGLLCIVTLTYVYLVNDTTINGVRWSKIDSEITAQRAVVSELESSYLSLKQSVTLSLAYAKGFTDVASVRFILSGDAPVVAAANEI